MSAERAASDRQRLTQALEAMALLMRLARRRIARLHRQQLHSPYVRRCSRLVLSKRPPRSLQTLSLVRPTLGARLRRLFIRLRQRLTRAPCSSSRTAQTTALLSRRLSRLSSPCRPDSTLSPCLLSLCHRRTLACRSLSGLRRRRLRAPHSPALASRASSTRPVSTLLRARLSKCPSRRRSSSSPRRAGCPWQREARWPSRTQTAMRSHRLATGCAQTHSASLGPSRSCA